MFVSLGSESSAVSAGPKKSLLSDVTALPAASQLPDTMKRAMARQAEAEREKRAKIIAAEGEALAAGELARAADVMMAHPLALQLRNLQTLVDISVDKNSTVIFPSPLMTTISEIGAFIAKESNAAGSIADLLKGVSGDQPSEQP